MPRVNKKELEKRIFEKTKVKVEKVFKSQVKDKITDEMIKKAVDKALEGFRPDQVVVAFRSPQYYCEKCGQCCRINNPIVVDIEDLINIAFYLGVDLQLVVANYAKTLENGGLSLKTNPCPFLQCNECSIYNVRPKICKFFPLQVIDDKVVPVIFKYCNFSKNLIVGTAISLILVELMKLISPEAYRELEEYHKQLQPQVPNSWEGQIKFLMGKKPNK